MMKHAYSDYYSIIQQAERAYLHTIWPKRDFMQQKNPLAKHIIIHIG